MRTIINLKVLGYLSICVLVSACGGGGGSSRSNTPVVPNISIGNAAVNEGDSGSQTVSVTVTLDRSATVAVSVDYATQDGTASAGADYTATSGTLTIPAGNTTGTIDVDVIGDTTDTVDEQFNITLSNANNGALPSGGASSTISINDDDSTANAVGLSSRPSNTSCVAPTLTTTNGTLGFEDAFPSLPNLALPMKLVQAPNDNSLFYAVLRNGGLDRFTNSPSVTSRERYLDLTVTANGEGGFLSAALHPDWPTTKEIYVSYTIQAAGFQSRLSRLVVTDDSTLPATYTEEVLLTVNQPQSNHNGGDIAFGPDNLLYYGIGDGGGGGDPDNYGQTTSTLLGNILRLDVLGVAFPSPAYNIPASNPFAANTKCGPSTNANACPEIFAYGLRNPWRMSFDTSNGDLWVGDVGQDVREEVDIVTLGGNYGWRCREGLLAFNTAGCASSGFIDPVYDYDHSAGDSSITGGFVYRGSAAPSLVGKYIFGDYTTGRVWSLENQGGTYVREELVDNSFNVAGFSQDNNGEVYVLAIGSGRVFKFTSSGGGGAINDNVPDNLQDTGCFNVATATPTSGMVPYQTAAQFWSDNADKDRWVALPNGQNINAANAAQWQFPNGSVIAKNFSLNSQLIETRLFMRHPSGDWAGYTYQWNDAQTTATRVRGGATRTVGGQTWIYPSESDCLSCHTSASGFVLGLETAQLNNDFTYPSTGRTDNQLEVFNHIGYFTNDVPEPVSNLTAMPDPMDTSANLDSRARAYLHTNCAQCHQPSGPTGVNLDLRFSTSLANTLTCNIAPSAGTLGIANAMLIAPGDPARSIVIERTNRRDAQAMPPLASNLVDTAGVALLQDWVTSLTACP